MTACNSATRRVKRCRNRFAAGILLLGLAGGLSAQDVARTFLKGPYLQAPGAKTMTVMWESPTNREGIVRYGRNGILDRALRLETPRPLTIVRTNSATNITASATTSVTKIVTTNRVFLYEMTLTNLRPNSVYAYSAETDGARAPRKQFKTFGAHPRKVVFIAYGDTRTNPKTHAAVAAHFRRYAPDFILHTGDLVTNGSQYDLWGKEFFAPLAPVIDEVPILPAIGNHEADGSNYLHYVHLPGKERWYSYDVGPMHVLSLDFHYEKPTDEQFAFARHDLLAAKAPWKIVFLHYPVFNIGGHNTGWGHAAYLPLFHQAKVDLVISGHSHIYERFRPIASGTGLEAWPITYITTGGGGAPLTTTFTHPALAARAATNHFVLIEATPTALKGRAITTNDTVLDTFELKKYGGRPPGNYFAQVYPEDALKVSFDVPPMLAGGLAAIPTTNSPARVVFAFRPLKSTQRPTEMEVTLAPGSAPYYEIEGPPLRFTTPSATESNKVVWASVRATGKAAIKADAQTKELSPTLMFQAKAKIGKVETIAYGQKCKISPTAAEAAKKLAEKRAW